MMPVQRSIAIFSLFVALMLMPSLVAIGNLTAHGAQPLSVTAPLAKDLGGRFVSDVKAGEQVTLWMTVLGAQGGAQAFTAVVDIRDGNGISVHIAWVPGVAAADGRIDVSVPWTAQKSGVYSVRVFIITDFRQLEVLSTVKSTLFSVSKSAHAEISGIANFATKWDQVNYVAYFSLLDTEEKETPYDGKATLTIVDATDTVRFAGSVQISGNDFRSFQRERGDELRILAYVWNLPGISVDKGIGQGTAKLSFTAKDGSVFSASTPIELRQLSGKDIISAYDASYKKFATEVDETLVEGNFKVKLDSVGHFTHLEGGTSGEQVTHFRADFTITNLSSEDLPGPLRLYVVDDKSNQYNEVAYNWTMQSGANVDAFTTVSGYKLFDDVREGASWVKVVVIGLNNPDDVLEINVIL
ncbi:MAG: hypothetical protein ACREAZ_06560 [Nitrososphaera sp.]